MAGETGRDGPSSERDRLAAPARPLPRPFTLHWGGGRIVEEAGHAGEYHQPVIQLLEYDDGALAVRFCSYNHRGMFQRNPMILGQEDIPGLREALNACPRLTELLRTLLLD